MSIIKLTQCYLRDSDKIKNPANNTYWFEWATKEYYINSDYIINITSCCEYEGQGKDYIYNKENFNSKVEINGVNKVVCEYVKETPQQIIKLINKSK